MSWLVTFGKAREGDAKKIAFVISPENSFAKIVMHPNDWDNPTDPNRDPFDKALYPEPLTKNQLFGILTANLQLHFDEVKEFHTEAAAKKLVESVTARNTGSASSKSSRYLNMKNSSISQIFVLLANHFDKLEWDQKENIGGLELKIAELRDEIANLQAEISPKERTKEAGAAPVTSATSTGKSARKTPQKKPSNNSRTNVPKPK